MRLIGVYGCDGIRQPSSFVVMCIVFIGVMDMGLPYHILCPPRGWRYVAISVAM